MSPAWIGLGANLGHASETLKAAVSAIGSLPETQLQASSSFYRTAPVDATGPDYLNAVVRVQTALAPVALLRALLAIETQHGRLRPYYHAPRTLDLDLLMHGRSVLSTPELVLPHPRMHERAFVLVPLAEIDPGQEIPGVGRVEDLLAKVAGQAIERLPHA